MSSANRQVEFNIETKLAELNLTPAARADALAVARQAEKVIAAVEWVFAALKRLTHAMALKPSLRT